MMLYNKDVLSCVFYIYENSCPFQTNLQCHFSKKKPPGISEFRKIEGNKVLHSLICTQHKYQIIGYKKSQPLMTMFPLRFASVCVCLRLVIQISQT